MGKKKIIVAAIGIFIIALIILPPGISFNNLPFQDLSEPTSIRSDSKGGSSMFDSMSLAELEEYDKGMELLNKTVELMIDLEERSRPLGDMCREVNSPLGYQNLQNKYNLPNVHTQLNTFYDWVNNLEIVAAPFMEDEFFLQLPVAERDYWIAAFELIYELEDSIVTTDLCLKNLQIRYG